MTDMTNLLKSRIRAVKEMQSKMSGLEDTIKGHIVLMLQDTKDPDGVTSVHGELDNCKTVSIHTLEKEQVWSPSYYISSRQTEILIPLISRAESIDQCQKIIQRVLDRGALKKGKEMIKINPKVREKLEEILSLLNEESE